MIIYTHAPAGSVTLRYTRQNSAVTHRTLWVDRLGAKLVKVKA